MLLTFFQITFIWIFFRSDSIDFALDFIRKIGNECGFYGNFIFPKALLGLIFLMLLIEWLGRKEHFALEKVVDNWIFGFRWAFYVLTGLLVFLCFGTDQQFIYFQF